MRRLFAVLALVGSVAACGSDGASPDITTSTTASPATSSSSTSTTASVAIDPTDAVFPNPINDIYYDDPVKVATDFVLEYLGFRAPIVGALADGGVPVQALPNGAVTDVRVNLLQDGHWWVTGAVSDEIDLTAPRPASILSSPAHLVGSGRAFEGHINVSIRGDEMAAVIGHGFVTGGGDIKRPFEGDIAFTAGDLRFGAIVLYAQGGENGDLILYATVIRVRFG
jgi:hypothetical protein